VSSTVNLDVIGREINANASSLTDIDVSLLLELDVTSLAVTVYPTNGKDLLALEDLDNIDWDLVATSVLGITDPIGQLSAWLSQVLSSLFDSLRRLIDSLFSALRSILDRIANVLSIVAENVRTLIDTIKNIIVTPILEALRWVQSVLPSLADLIKGAVITLADFIKSLPDIARDFANRMATVLAEIIDRVRAGLEVVVRLLATIPDVIKELIGRVSALFSELLDRVRAGFEGLLGALAGIPDTIRELIAKASEAIGRVIDIVKDRLESILRTIANIPDIVKDIVNRIASMLAELLDRARAGFERLLELIPMVTETIRDVASRVATIITDILDKVRTGAEAIVTIITKAGDAIRDLVSRVSDAISDMINRVVEGVRTLTELLARTPDYVKNLIEAASRHLAELLDKARAGIEGLLELVPRIAGVLRDLANEVAAGISEIVGKAREALSQLIETIARAPEVLKTAIDSIVGDIATGVGGVVEWVRKGFENIVLTLREWFERSREWFEAVTTTLKEIGYVFMGFVNAVLELPHRFAEVFKPVHDFYSKLLETLDNLAKDPTVWFRTNVIEPLLGALAKAKDALLDMVKTLIDTMLGALSWVWDKATDIVTKVSSKAVEFGRDLISGAVAVAETVVKFFEGVISKWTVTGSPAVYAGFWITAKTVEDVLQASLTRTAGIAENLWLLGGGLLMPYWVATLLPLVLRGIVRAYGDLEITFEPSMAGSKALGLGYKIKLSEFADALVRGFETFVTGYSIGVSMAIASTIFVNIQHLYVPRVVAYYDARIRELLKDVLEEEFRDEATVNMFVKPLTETALIDYVRRSLALSEGVKNEKVLKQLLATTRAYLKLYGLPKWYIDWFTKHPEQLKITFKDRFGVDRKLYLSHIFELPTHSEMARMTQRDIFPGVDVMKRLGWVRGWNEDLTTMIYLLTFKYPSFEKLWTFYMRALSGMLWFKAPEHVKAIFDREAEEVGAGKPISPLDLQKALIGPDQVKAFETALNTYFKWLEYSNFSWFTDKTTMYGINVGAEIVGKLGGWTADSWLMIDVAADIPTKIDMRWMSRYGIFLHMARKFEEAGVKFESYAPMVTVVTRLLEPQAATPIQVDLRWFSKLLQATGLHPAWVPVTTVAENIMVIADEMTLLRTGWLNLFKEGMITVEDAERYLGGLLTVSYLVGYWDPERKTWTSGWINLPVRWLPHERRLLQLRMTIDRVMDVYREIYGYIKSGIRTMAITPEEGLDKLRKLIGELDKHYRELTKTITGIEMALRLDEKYATVWLELQKLAQDIEAVERVRIWWSRTSGWLLYRVAYGWVSEEEIDRFIDTVTKFIPLHPREVESYKEIAKALLGIARKESIPSPSTLAVFAEYMVIDVRTVEDVLSKYNVPREYWELWKTYIQVKPIKSDYKAVINTALRALRYGAITEEEFKGLLGGARAYGFTPTEIALIQLRAELEHAIEEVRLWRPSLLTVINVIEYVPEAIELLKYYKVDPVFRPVIEKYARVKPLIDEARVLVNALYRAKRYTTIPAELEKKVIEIVRALGVTSEELMLRDLALELTVLAEEAKVWIPSPSTLAVLSEYVTLPRELVESALRARRIPEEWMSVWIQYITVKPLKPDYRAVISTALRALRFRVITEEQWKRILETSKMFGFTDPEVTLIQLRAELEMAIEEAREHVPTPAMLATIAEVVPEARKHMDRVFEARRVRGIWAEIWAKYIYLRPVMDDIRGWVTAMFDLAERLIITEDQLKPVFELLKSYGWEDIEIEIAKKTMLAVQVRLAFGEVHGSVRALAGMSRHSNIAADLAYSRAIKLIEALPVDKATKELLKQMWKEYITGVQVYPEARSYIGELIAAYGDGVIDDTTLDRELEYLKKLGVPEARLALVKRQAMLRRARRLARVRL
jgi:phage-related protein